MSQTKHLELIVNQTIKIMKKENEKMQIVSEESSIEGTIYIKRDAFGNETVTSTPIKKVDLKKINLPGYKLSHIKIMDGKEVAIYDPI